MGAFFGFLSFAAFVCFIIGMIKPGLIVFWTKKKNRGMACLYLIPMFVFFIIAVASSPSTGSTDTKAISSSTESSNVAPASSASKDTASSKAESKAPATVKVDQILESGFYTVGTDIPAGKYNFTAVSGGGNVITDDGSVNEIMGVKSKGDGYTQTFSNANLEDGVVLFVSGVKLRVTCDSASGTLKKRSQSISKTYVFGPGNYTAGTDFDAGTYDIVAVSGGGNVITEDGKLNAIMGTDKSEDMYVQNYHNVDLSDGAVLKITGVKVKLTPSK